MKPAKFSKSGGLVLWLILLLVLVGVLSYPSLSLAWFKLQEPIFRVPLGVEGSVLVRKDPYGSGLFGAKRSGRRKHRGIDLRSPIGTEVLASKSGLAIIGKKKNGMGRYVEILHPDGWKTLYGHLSRIDITDRQRVRQGQVIGAVGKSGNAGHRLIQAHVHFEIWNPDQVATNPLEQIPVERTNR